METEINRLKQELMRTKKKSRSASVGREAGFAKQKVINVMFLTLLHMVAFRIIK